MVEVYIWNGPTKKSTRLPFVVTMNPWELHEIEKEKNRKKRWGEFSEQKRIQYNPYKMINLESNRNLSSNDLSQPSNGCFYNKLAPY